MSSKKSTPTKKAHARSYYAPLAISPLKSTGDRGSDAKSPSGDVARSKTKSTEKREVKSTTQEPDSDDDRVPVRNNLPRAVDPVPKNLMRDGSRLAFCVYYSQRVGAYPIVVHIQTAGPIKPITIADVVQATLPYINKIRLQDAVNESPVALAQPTPLTPATAHTLSVFTPHQTHDCLYQTTGDSTGDIKTCLLSTGAPATVLVIRESGPVADATRVLYKQGLWIRAMYGFLEMSLYLGYPACLDIGANVVDLGLAATYLALHPDSHRNFEYPNKQAIGKSLRDYLKEVKKSTPVGEMRFPVLGVARRRVLHNFVRPTASYQLVPVRVAYAVREEDGAWAFHVKDKEGAIAEPVSESAGSGTSRPIVIDLTATPSPSPQSQSPPASSSDGKDEATTPKPKAKSKPSPKTPTPVAIPKGKVDDPALFAPRKPREPASATGNTSPRRLSFSDADLVVPDTPPHSPPHISQTDPIEDVSQSQKDRDLQTSQRYTFERLESDGKGKLVPVRGERAGGLVHAENSSQVQSQQDPERTETQSPAVPFVPETPPRNKAQEPRKFDMCPYCGKELVNGGFYHSDCYDKNNHDGDTESDDDDEGDSEMEDKDKTNSEKDEKKHPALENSAKMMDLAQEIAAEAEAIDKKLEDSGIYKALGLEAAASEDKDKAREGDEMDVKHNDSKKEEDKGYYTKDWSLFDLQIASSYEGLKFCVEQDRAVLVAIRNFYGGEYWTRVRGPPPPGQDRIKPIHFMLVNDIQSDLKRVPTSFRGVFIHDDGLVCADYPVEADLHPALILAYRPTQRIQGSPFSDKFVKGVPGISLRNDLFEGDEPKHVYEDSEVTGWLVDSFFEACPDQTSRQGPFSDGVTNYNLKLSAKHKFDAQVMGSDKSNTKKKKGLAGVVKTRKPLKRRRSDAGDSDKPDPKRSKDA